MLQWRDLQTMCGSLLTVGKREEGASEAKVTVNGESSTAKEEEKEPWMEARKSNW